MVRAANNRTSFAPTVLDLHCHLLPGIDDGPQSIEESAELARAASEDGTRTIVATPHVNWQYSSDARMITRLTEAMNVRLRDDNIDVTIAAGAEIAAMRAPEIDDHELSRLALGNGPWLLIEPPFTPVAIGLDSIVLDLMRSGHRILIAHPERCPALHRDPAMLGTLVRAGALTSVTAGSLAGQFGEPARSFAMRLLHEDMLHNVASDAHDTRRRTPRLTSALRQAGFDDHLIKWLLIEVPSAILSGDEVPTRPPGAGLHGQSHGGIMTRLKRRVERRPHQHG